MKCFSQQSFALEATRETDDQVGEIGEVGDGASVGITMLVVPTNRTHGRARGPFWSMGGGKMVIFIKISSSFLENP